MNSKKHCKIPLKIKSSLKSGKKKKEKNSTWAARTAAVVFPEPPLPKKVTNLVDFSEEFAMIGARMHLRFSAGACERGTEMRRGEAKAIAR